jgi:NADH-quinone oxidoreductase subunit A
MQTEALQHSFIPLLIFFSGGLVFIAIGLCVSYLLQKQKPNPEKLSFYECGEDAVLTQSRFNIRYFLAALVFLLMEVELVLLAPVILNRRGGIPGMEAGQSDSLLRTEMLIFLILLGAGFLLALGLKYFDWERPAKVIPQFRGPVPDSVYLSYRQTENKA